MRIHLAMSQMPPWGLIARSVSIPCVRQGPHVQGGDRKSQIRNIVHMDNCLNNLSDNKLMRLLIQRAWPCTW